MRDQTVGLGKARMSIGSGFFQSPSPPCTTSTRDTPKNYGKLEKEKEMERGSVEFVWVFKKTPEKWKGRKRGESFWGGRKKSSTGAKFVNKRREQTQKNSA